jgi:hypothetical protein
MRLAPLALIQQLLFVLFFLLPSTISHAAEMYINGFASLVAGQVLDEDELPPEGSSSEGLYLSYDDRLSFQPDSRYGIQFRGDLSDGLSVMGQLIGRSTESYDSRFSWAFVSYDVSDRFNIKVGRSRLPQHMFSDFLDVGFAYHWIAPPAEVYIPSTQNFANLDGINFNYTLRWGDVSLKSVAMIGRNSAKFLTSAADIDVDFANYYTIAEILEVSDWLKLHLSRSEASATLDGTAGPVTFSIEDKKYWTNGFGVSADFKSWFLISEYSSYEIADSIERLDSWYVSGGVRVGDFTIHATHGKSENDDKTTDQATDTLGVRYLFHPSADLKAEIQKQDNKATSTEPVLVRLAVDVMF